MGKSGEILPAGLPVVLRPNPNRSVKCLPDRILSLRRYPDAKGFDGLLIFIQPALESKLVPQGKGLGIGTLPACNGTFPCSILQDNAGGPQLFRQLRKGKRRRKYRSQDGQAVFLRMIFRSVALGGRKMGRFGYTSLYSRHSSFLGLFAVRRKSQKSMG